jgi:hypothetical protein
LTVQESPAQLPVARPVVSVNAGLAVPSRKEIVPPPMSARVTNGARNNTVMNVNTFTKVVE